MAVIGEMHYLTIGDNTYSIPTSGGSTVSITRSLTSGTKSATITVDGTSYDIYSVANTDTKVTQSTSTSSTEIPVLLRDNKDASTDSGTADAARFVSTVTVQPSTGNLKATKFNGYTLAAASAKGVDTSISTASSSTNLPTSAAVASFVEGKGYITSYTDENMKWTASTSTNTYYPLQSTSTATTSTANTLNSISFYQYYNTAGGYRRLQMGNATAYTSSGGAYGTIRLYGTGATYYGDLNPGTIGANSLTANRTWTLPNATGTIALTSNIPTKVSDLTNDSGFITSADVPEGASAYTGTISAVGTSASNGTNNGFARGDHVHNITGTTITSALGYTPYNSTNPNGYTSNTGTVTGMTTTAGAHTAGNQTVSSGIITTNIPTKTSHLTNDSGFITSYTDENLKWTASTSSNTYYPLQSTSTATTSTANTLNGIDFYQYYNTAGGYRRLDLGNATAYKSSGGAYGTIRLYGAAATYYGDLVPGVLGTTSGDGHISANRTWTLPDKTGTIALTSDIPDVSSFITDAGVTKITTTAGAHTAITNSTGAVSFNVPTKTSHLTNDSGFITTDTKVSTAAATSGTTYYPVIGTDTTSAETKYYDKAGFVYYTINGIAGDASETGQGRITLGNNTSFSSASGKKGILRLYGTTAYYTDIVSGAPSANRTITLPNTTGTVALTSDIPTKVSDLTNDSGFITTDTNTTYALSGALSSHKFTSTLTAGGSGSGTSTSDFTLAAGTGITITDNTSTRTMTIASSVVNTDEKLKVSAAANTTATYYPVLTTDTTTAENKIYLPFFKSGFSSTDYDNFIFYIGNGLGVKGQLDLGNPGTSGNYTSIETSGTTQRVITLPDKTGTVALTSDIPSITLNGSSTTSPSFYAPTSVGTSGYYLKSNGSGAPSWTSFPTIPTITLNGSSTTSPSFYAPTGAGTSGQYLKSNGSGAPTWTNFPTIPSKTSDLTNDSGFITTDTNTTYALSGALSSHKFTSTLTAGGSGSGTSTSDFTLAAGTGITITDDTSNRKMTIACSITNTDTQVTVAALTSGTAYYPILATGTGTATRQIDSTLGGLKYTSTAGTTSTVGTAKLQLGNNTASGTANNERGQLILYGSTAYAHTIQGAPTAARTITLPDKAGTVALTSDVVSSNATTSAAGLMSATDKTKLDNIGSVNQSGTGTSINISSGTTFVSLSSSASLTLTKGTWVITGTIQYSTNATGFRALQFYLNNTSYTYGQVQVPAASGYPTYVSSTVIAEVTSASSTVYLMGRQNSGSTLTATAYLRVGQVG